MNTATTLAIPAVDSPFASPAQRDQDEAFKQQFIELVEEKIESWLRTRMTK